jgi:hypothetical protein
MVRIMVAPPALSSVLARNAQAGAPVRKHAPWRVTKEEFPAIASA